MLAAASALGTSTGAGRAVGTGVGGGMIGGVVGGELTAVDWCSSQGLPTLHSRRNRRRPTRGPRPRRRSSSSRSRSARCSSRQSALRHRRAVPNQCRCVAACPRISRAPIIRPEINGGDVVAHEPANCRVRVEIGERPVEHVHEGRLRVDRRLGCGAGVLHQREHPAMMPMALRPHRRRR
jgi:hypothetical protein